MNHSPNLIDRRALPLVVRDRILDQIRDRQLRPGSQIPPESALCEEFGVSRSTIREAIKLLEREGIIDVQHGRGSFVTGIAQLGTERPLTRFESVTEMMRRLGYTVENRVVAVRERHPDEHEAAELAMQADDLVVHLERLRLHDGQPFVFTVNVVPRSVFPEPLEQVEWAASMIDLLDARGHEVVASSAHLRATSAPDALADAGVDVSVEPWLLISETCVTATGDPVLLAHDYHRGDVFTFHTVRRRSSD
jgi:GntR family transcriptional regulator